MARFSWHVRPPPRGRQLALQQVGPEQDQVSVRLGPEAAPRRQWLGVWVRTWGQELPASVEAFDHEIGLALIAHAPHHRDQLAEQEVMRRCDPHTFDVTGTRLLSLVAG